MLDAETTVGKEISASELLITEVPCKIIAVNKSKPINPQDLERQPTDHEHIYAILLGNEIEMYLSRNNSSRSIGFDLGNVERWL